MRRSLALKLFAAFFFVAILGTGVSILVIGDRTLEEFEQFVAADEERDRHRGQSGPGRGNNNNGTNNNPEPPFIIEDDTLERAFVAAIRRALFIGACLSIILVLSVGLFFSNALTRPLRELTEATQRLAGGELGYEVPVRSKDELGRLADSFNQMSLDLAKMTQQRKQMTADIAHDLRTPLSVISGYTEALADGKLQATPDMYATIHQQVGHLKHLIEDLRTLSLADAGELRLNLRLVNPKALLERIFLAHMPAAEEKGIELTIDAAADLPELNLDLERMTQVLGNLVSNALRYTPSGGTITLRATPNRFEIEDTGIGIRPEIVDTLFDRFVRGDESRQRAEGQSGLGLAIARSIVDAHGGIISAASPGADQGSTFTIEFK